MSAAAVHSEPYKFSAGALALAVHLVFFALLYFGVSWHADPPQGMVVDIWNALPDDRPVLPKAVEPPPEPVPPEPTPAPAPEPPAPPPRKIDIDLGDRKKPKVKEAEKPEPPKAAPQPQPVQPQAQPAPSEQERARLAEAAAKGRIVDDYKLRIIAKIRRNIFMPYNVPDDARTEFDVTLLPGGTVLSARRTRPSGNEAYDAAVERAIWKSQPLPLPEDMALFNRFRELHLIFTPKE